MSFYEYRCGDRMYVKSDAFPSDRIIHGFTSKSGGVSRGNVIGFNLGFRVNDDMSSVRENYRLLSGDLGIDLERTVLAKQTHTDNIRIVTEEDCGKGITRESDIEDTDGLLTNIAGIALVVFSADCVPVLLCEPNLGVVAAVHAGWRGSVKGIAAKCVRLMAKNFGAEPQSILAAIGPSIGPCCFEFGSNASEIFGNDYCTEKSPGKYLVDLWRYNRNLLLGCGLRENNIDISGICTVCQSDKYYSYRTHRDKTGRQGAIIMLRE